MLCDVLFPQTTDSAGRVARELANALKRRGTEVHFLTRATSRITAQQDDDTTYYPPLRTGNFLHYHKIFRHLLGE